MKCFPYSRLLSLEFRGPRQGSAEAADSSVLGWGVAVSPLVDGDYGTSVGFVHDVLGFHCLSVPGDHEEACAKSLFDTHFEPRTRGAWSQGCPEVASTGASAAWRPCCSSCPLFGACTLWRLWASTSFDAAATQGWALSVKSQVFSRCPAGAWQVGLRVRLRRLGGPMERGPCPPRLHHAAVCCLAACCPRQTIAVLLGCSTRPLLVANWGGQPCSTSISTTGE